MSLKKKKNRIHNITFILLGKGSATYEIADVQLSPCILMDANGTS